MPDGDGEWERDFRDLREGYRPKLARALSELKARFRSRTDGRIAGDELESVRALVHRVKGTAGTFGFDKASAALAGIEEQLDRLRENPGAEPNRAWDEIDRALARAREDVQK